MPYNSEFVGAIRVKEGYLEKAQVEHRRRKINNDIRYKEKLKKYNKYLTYYPGVVIERERDGKKWFSRIYTSRHSSSAASYYKKKARRKVRHCRTLLQYGDFRRAYDLWWSIY